MNHTIKGIIIVVAITSMLVLGATTMIPIVQNSFASKKSDFKKAEHDPNTNTNTNTNSADSTSSSSATADNTNNIANSACAVAVTCSEGSTPTSTPPATGTLEIHKVCDPPCNPPSIFPIQVTGNNPQPSSVTLGAGDTQVVTLGPGTFTIHESVPPGFLNPTFTGNCMQTIPFDATGAISAGQTLHCTITNSRT